MVLLIMGISVMPITLLSQGLVPCSGTECQACHLILLGQNILEFLVSISAAIAVVGIAWGGLLLATSGTREAQRTKAKSIFVNVGIGFLLVLASWLIVDTIMKVFAGGGTALGPWNELQCVSLPEYSDVIREGTAPGSTYDVVSGGGASDGTQLTHAEAEQLARQFGASVVSTGNCSDASNSKCTSLSGIRADTLSQVQAISRACPNCNIVITGGTEAGHSGGSTSHAAGYKIDLSGRDPNLDAFLRSNLTSSGTRTGTYGGDRYVDSCGNEYVRESNHWDISVTGGTCGL